MNYQIKYINIEILENLFYINVITFTNISFLPPANTLLITTYPPNHNTKYPTTSPTIATPDLTHPPPPPIPAYHHHHTSLPPPTTTSYPLSPPPYLHYFLFRVTEMTSQTVTSITAVVTAASLMTVPACVHNQPPTCWCLFHNRSESSSSTALIFLTSLLACITVYISVNILLKINIFFVTANLSVNQVRIRLFRVLFWM